MKGMQSIVKYLFLANILFLVGHPLADVLIFEGVVLDESTLAFRKKWYTSGSGQCPVKKCIWHSCC